jgi:hypothetical protein
MPIGRRDKRNKKRMREGKVLLREDGSKKGERSYERTNNSRGTESNSGERK